MDNDIRSAHTQRADTSHDVADIAGQLAGVDPSAIVFFSGGQRDGGRLSAELWRAFPGARVVGCSTAGQFTDRARSSGGVAVLAISKRKARRAAAALAHFGSGVHEGV